MPSAASATPILTPRAYYKKMTLAQRQCRARIFHRFPDLNPDDDELPAGFRVLFHDADGRYYIQETCECCGRLRFSVSIWEDGHFHPVARYRYADPDDEDWVHVPAGVLTAAMAKGFLQDDCAPMLRKAAQVSERQARAEAAEAERAERAAARRSGTAAGRRSGTAAAG
jgi:hypothetical protein